MQAGLDALTVETDVAAIQVRAVIAQAVGKYRYRAARGQLSAEAVIQVDDRSAGLAEQPRLGCAVAGHVAVVVQVIAAQVGAHPDIELQRSNPALLQRV